MNSILKKISIIMATISICYTSINASVLNGPDYLYLLENKNKNENKSSKKNNKTIGCFLDFVSKNKVPCGIGVCVLILTIVAKCIGVPLFKNKNNQIIGTKIKKFKYSFKKMLIEKEGIVFLEDVETINFGNGTSYKMKHGNVINLKINSYDGLVEFYNSLSYLCKPTTQNIKNKFYCVIFGSLNPGGTNFFCNKPFEHCSFSFFDSFFRDKNDTIDIFILFRSKGNKEIFIKTLKKCDLEHKKKDSLYIIVDNTYWPN